MPAAWEISVTDTVALLEVDFPGFAEAVARGQYALWLGSGISLDQVVGVPAVIGRVIEYLRFRMDPVDNNCRHKVALDQILSLLSAPERACVHLDQPVDTWPEADRITVTKRLANSYSEVLETPLEGEADEDFLLWKAVDVPGSFTGEEPDAEHLCIVILTLEGAFRDICSANWDYLIESAERTLTGGVGTTIDVCIQASDFQNAGGRASLLKYHGCAVRAVANEPVYRPLLIARTPQITQYRTNAAYHVMRNHLVGLVQTRRTLMIGFSAQDSDVQQIFVDGAVQSGWNWTDSPRAFLFAEDALMTGQKTVLSTAYGADYNPNRNAIEAAARVRAFAKPLLIALTLSVLELKTRAFARLALPAGWIDAERDAAVSGLRALRDSTAAQCKPSGPERRAFIHALIAAMGKGLDLYHHGHIDHGHYIPLSGTPLQQVAGVPSASGLRQASMAMSLLGRGAAAGNWTIAPDVTGNTPIALASAGRTTRVFLAANDDVAVRLIQNGHIAPDSDDTVLLLSASPNARLPRSPSGRRRTGKVGLREICMSSVIESAIDAADLMASFKRSASL